MQIAMFRKGAAIKTPSKCVYWITVAAITAVMLLMIIHPAFADGDPRGTIIEMLKKFINIISLIFSAIGVIFAVYAAGQLILAFKNEDADSKSRGATMLVVGVILAVNNLIINALDLTQYLPSI